MNQPVYDALRPVRRRLRWQLVARSTAIGLLAGGIAGLLLAGYRWGIDAGAAIRPGLAAAAIGLGPLVGLVIGLMLPIGWRRAAAAVDTHYRLKDRSVTAIDFLRKATPSPIHTLQVGDAATHLEGVSAAEAAPWRWPRVLPASALAVALAAVGLLLPAPRAVVAQPPVVNEAIAAVADHVQDNLEELDNLARAEKDPELEELVKELKEISQEMAEPGVDTKEAMAKLSEMQQSILGLQSQFNLGLVDGQMQALGEAMASIEALESAGTALQEGKYDKAAEALEQPIDPAELPRREANALKEKLKKAAQSAGEAGLGGLSGAVTDVEEGIDDAPSGMFQKGTKELAKLSRKQGSRRKIKEILDLELKNLEECKGECQSDKAVRVRMPGRRDTPTSSAGAEVSGNTEGAKTERDAGRQRENLTGNPGDGPSEVETIHSPEGRQTAARGYRDAYDRARAKSEAVLDTEPIPLGHRQTIRRYFELIRPQSESNDPAGSTEDR